MIRELTIDDFEKVEPMMAALHKIHVENSGKQDYAGYRYQHQTAAGNF